MNEVLQALQNLDLSPNPGEDREVELIKSQIVVLLRQFNGTVESTVSTANAQQKGTWEAAVAADELIRALAEMRGDE
jgi:hypothetical protein